MCLSKKNDIKSGEMIPKLRVVKQSEVSLDVPPPNTNCRTEFVTQVVSANHGRVWPCSLHRWVNSDVVPFILTCRISGDDGKVGRGAKI